MKASKAAKITEAAETVTRPRAKIITGIRLIKIPQRDTNTGTEPTAMRAGEMVPRDITRTRLNITVNTGTKPSATAQKKAESGTRLSVMESIRTNLAEMALRDAEIGTRPAEMALKDADTGIRLNATASTKTRRDVMRLNEMRPDAMALKVITGTSPSTMVLTNGITLSTTSKAITGTRKTTRTKPTTRARKAVVKSGIRLPTLTITSFLLNSDRLLNHCLLFNLGICFYIFF